MSLAERLGSTMLRDPAMSTMLSQMSNPMAMQQMKAKMEVSDVNRFSLSRVFSFLKISHASQTQALKQDPEMAEIMKDIEVGGPGAMMRYWNDPTVLSKLGRAMGGEPAIAQLSGAAPSASVVEDEDKEDDEEEGEEDELTLHTAASAGDSEALAVLLAAPGCAVNALDSAHRTALHLAAGYGEVACVTALLAANADPDVVDSKGNTCLHFAAGYGRSEVVALLLKAGASVVVKNSDFKTAADVARMNDQTAALRMLEQDAYL